MLRQRRHRSRAPRPLPLSDLSDEPKPLAGNGADQPPLRAAVPDRLPNRRNPAAEGRFRDDATSPDCGDEIVLADHAFAVSEQIVENVENLRLNCDETGSAPQFA